MSKGATSMVGRLRSASSSLLNRAMLAATAGITFGGKRDIYDALGYSRILRPQDFRDRYKRGGLAARIVEAYPQATWRGGAEVLEDEDPATETEFETAFDDMASRLKIWSTFYKADVLAGLGQFSALLIGAPGELETELPKTLRPEDVVYLTPYSQLDVLVLQIEVNTSSPRFGLPTLYQIKRLAGNQALGVSVASRNVHWTRVIHVADNILDDRVFGTPRLERPWNTLDDLDKVTGGGAEAFWKRADQGIIFDVDKDLEISPEDIQKVEDAADELIHGYRRVMLSRGMTPNPQGSDVANFSAPVDALITILAGITGIPKRLLVGSERGELSSTQDRENWNTRVTDRRNDFAEQVLVRPFVERMIEHRALPEPVEFHVRWPEMESLSTTERADVADKLSKLNGQVGGTVITPAEIRDQVLRMEPLTTEDLTAHADTLEVDPNAKQNLPQPVNPFAVPAVPAEGTDASPAPKVAARYSPVRASHRDAIRSDLVGAFKHRARRALRSARRAHNHGAVRGSVHHGHGEVMRAMLAPLAVLKAGLSNLTEVRAEAHHRMRSATRSPQVKYARSRTLPSNIREARRTVTPSDASTQYAADKAAEQITAIDEQTRNAVSSTIARGIEEGWTASRLSNQLESVVGLNDRQVEALDNLRSRLEDAQPGDEISFGDRMARVPRDGGSDDWIDRQVSRYSDDLLAERADMIAETSLDEALADGKRDGWREMADSGELPAGTVRVWKASEGACPECQDLDGQTAELDGQYEGPDGEVDGPLLHPLCNCDEELFTPDSSGGGE